MNCRLLRSILPEPEAQKAERPAKQSLYPAVAFLEEGIHSALLSTRHQTGQSAFLESFWFTTLISSGTFCYDTLILFYLRK
jgi:hypothetical protein